MNVASFCFLILSCCCVSLVSSAVFMRAQTEMWRAIESRNLPVIRALLQQVEYHNFLLPVLINGTMTKEFMKETFDILFNLEGITVNTLFDGFTALHVACLKDQRDSVEVLLAYEGINVSQVNDKLETCLHFCFSDEDEDEDETFNLKHLEVVQILLLDGRIDVNACDYRGKTGLHYASARNYFPVVNELISKGTNIDLNIQDRDNFTALHHAVLGGHLEIVELLVGEGADVSLVNNKGKTARDLAIEKNFEAIAGILEEAEISSLKIILK